MTNRRKRRTAFALASGFVLGNPLAPVSAETVPEIVVLGSEQATEEVQVRDVRVEDGVVSGVVTNNTGNELRDVRLLIRYDWLWKKEFSPGHDSPGRAIVYFVQEDIPPNGQAPFTYHPESPLQQRPDGRFLTSVVVLRYTQFR